MALLSEHLVGRAEELGALDQLLVELETGEPAATALVGEPGIGKTRLLTELAARADARGHLVLGGSASELERDLPFWVFVDALDEYLQGLPPRRLEAIDEDVRSELAHVFPSLARFEAAGGAVSQHERYRTYRRARAARATHVDHAARAGGRRSPLGRLWIRRAARGAAAPAAGGGCARRPGCPSPSSAGARHRRARA